MNLCGKLLTEREGKSIGLAFFLVVAIKSNLSTFAAAKIVLFFVLCDKTLIFLSHRFLDQFRTSSTDSTDFGLRPAPHVSIDKRIRMGRKQPILSGYRFIAFLRRSTLRKTVCAFSCGRLPRQRRSMVQPFCCRNGFGHRFRF